MLTVLLAQPAAPPWQLHLGRRYTGPPRHESAATEPGAELLLEYGSSTYWKDMEMISYSIAKPLKQACERKAAECAPFAEAIRHCKEELKERREKEALLQAEVEQLRAENARLRASPALSQLE